MKVDETDTCAVCGAVEAVILCDHCDKPLCRECRTFEIWGTGAEDLSVKYFCPACKNNPDVNPWGAHENEFGLGEVLDIVNHDKEYQAVQAA